MQNDIILLGHGSGGKLSHQLLDGLIIPTLSGTALKDQNDAAVLAIPPGEGRLAFTTDSYVVDPLFFPGGNIGDLAINGTVNDLAMSGARPLAISVGLILEEGLPLADLKRILQSMRSAAEVAEVTIVTGDTKVVPRGKADRLFINTAGIGMVEHGLTLGGSQARTGDKVLINGPIGDHGMAILSRREGLEMETDICSDCAPLHGLVADILAAGGEAVHVLRDPTRGGVATTLKEIALQSQVEITLHEKHLPCRREVLGICRLLGLDPLYVANEGKVLCVVAEEKTAAVLEAMQKHPLGQQACVIGEVHPSPSGRVTLRTTIGGLRSVDMLTGEQLPRIC
ncbi:MAG: hydrogenase expression/formation protein HypE [Desulfuromonadales bacterium]|nr:hydrogenase expression/formation protein HypE [Desulfuromonadales bacterium]MDW7758084.1 hydrogenase expression/formation protein HypE [Desulfuromonadales bacterium]